METIISLSFLMKVLPIILLNKSLIPLLILYVKYKAVKTKEPEKLNNALHNK